MHVRLFASPIVLDSFAQNPTAAERPRSAADYDDDGDVDGSDFLTWQRGLGLAGGASSSQGDANGDATVDELDLTVWKQTFNGSTVADQTALSATVAVPEPGLAVFTVVVAWGLFRRIPNRRRSS